MGLGHVPGPAPARIAGARHQLALGQRRVEVGEGDDFVTEVIAFVARERLRVRGFRTEIPTLEDVFLKLTGHGIRD